MWGVFQLARYHPQIVSDSQEIPIARGSTGGADAPTPASSTTGTAPKTGSIKITEAVSKVWPDPPVRDKDDPPRAER